MSESDNPSNGSTSDNFNPEDSLKLKQLTESIEQPHNFAKIFCDAATSQTKIRETLKDVLRELLKSDEDARDIVKSVVREVDKSDLKRYIKKFAGLVWAVFLVALGAIFTFVIQFFSG